MRTIGAILKEERLKKNWSLVKLEKSTRIKKSFIIAIEAEEWSKLPEFPVVTGFIKSIAHTLSLDEKMMVSLLKRDYPPKSLRINPKPDVGNKFIWSPKRTFIASIVVVAVLVLGYLGYQYSQFVKPPYLVVLKPQQGQTVDTSEVEVSGKTDSASTIKVNNQPVLVDENGVFDIQIQIYEGTDQIVVKAIGRSGKETVVTRNIKPNFAQ